VRRRDGEDKFQLGCRQSGLRKKRVRICRIRGRGRKRFTVISFVSFDEAPAVYINDLTLHSAGAPEHIKSANRLSEAFADSRRPGSLLNRQVGGRPVVCERI